MPTSSGKSIQAKNAKIFQNYGAAVEMFLALISCIYETGLILQDHSYCEAVMKVKPTEMIRFD